ncbi:hypothetical protein Mame_05141 (plasmid) [Martelella mediterranea DSM 17316]|uniref:Uncharacterized protein n=1 Tax=Martelella mediterranea DSM 17316 TaxID=1122214 RepID=A0A1U9Z9P3_9HYPH|nr:hypothetical protein Mame_05141 [Martelella mediterranea DSM 17316]
MVGHAGIGTLRLGDQGQPVTVDNCEAHQFTRVFGEAARRRLGNSTSPDLLSQLIPMAGILVVSLRLPRSDCCT